MPVSSPTKNGFARQNFDKPKAKKRLLLPPKFEENVFDGPKSQKHDFEGVATIIAPGEDNVVGDQAKVEFDRSKEKPNSLESV